MLHGVAIRFIVQVRSDPAQNCMTSQKSNNSKNFMLLKLEKLLTDQRRLTKSSSFQALCIAAQYGILTSTNRRWRRLINALAMNLEYGGKTPLRLQNQENKKCALALSGLSSYHYNIFKIYLVCVDKADYFGLLSGPQIKVRLAHPPTWFLLIHPPALFVTVLLVCHSGSVPILLPDRTLNWSLYLQQSRQLPCWPRWRA